MNITLLESLEIDAAYLEDFAGKLEAMGHHFTAYETPAKDEEELLKRARGQEILMIANHPLPDALIRQLDQLKMIAVAFTGVDHVGLEACREQGIDVLNCAGYSDQAVAELVIGMSLSLLRRLKTADRTLRSGGTAAGLAGSEISGKKVGIIGLGNIGLRTAQLFAAFGAEVSYFNRSRKDESGFKYLPLEELLKESDIVSLHLPLNEETRGFMSRERLELMREDAIFINCARGPIADEKALAELLKEGRIGAAAADVYSEEPPLPEEHPLLTAPRTLLTPHIGFYTKEAMRRRAAIEFDNVLSYLRGEKKNLC